MGLVKVEEAINTWVVANNIDEAMRQFADLPPHKQAMMLAILAQFHKEEVAGRTSNIIPLVVNG